MQTLIIPAIILIPFIVFLILAIRDRFDGVGRSLGAIMFGMIFVVSLIGCPVQYFTSRNIAWQSEQYYEQIILPNVVEEGNGFVVVENIEAGVWQAGDSNVYDFNSYIVTTRYWQEIPIINSVIFPVPEQLKYVRVQR